MYEQEGEADRQGNLAFIVLGLHKTSGSYGSFVSMQMWVFSRFASYGDTLFTNILT